MSLYSKIHLKKKKYSSPLSKANPSAFSSSHLTTAHRIPIHQKRQVVYGRRVSLHYIRFHCDYLRVSVCFVFVFTFTFLNYFGYIELNLPCNNGLVYLKLCVFILFYNSIIINQGLSNCKSC